MELLGFYLGSLVASVAIKKITKLEIHRILADNGYFLSPTFRKSINLNTDIDFLNHPICEIIPGINLLQAIYQAQFCYETSWLITDRLKTLGMLIEIDKKRQQKYDKKPTGRNAIAIANEAFFIKSPIEKFLSKFTKSSNDGEALLEEMKETNRKFIEDLEKDKEAKIMKDEEYNAEIKNASPPTPDLIKKDKEEPYTLKLKVKSKDNFKNKKN